MNWVQLKFNRKVLNFADPKKVLLLQQLSTLFINQICFVFNLKSQFVGQSVLDRTYKYYEKKRVNTPWCRDDNVKHDNSDVQVLFMSRILFEYVIVLYFLLQWSWSSCARFTYLSVGVYHHCKWLLEVSSGTVTIYSVAVCQNRTQYPIGFTETSPSLGKFWIISYSNLSHPQGNSVRNTIYPDPTCSYPMWVNPMRYLVWQFLFCNVPSVSTFFGRLPIIFRNENTTDNDLSIIKGDFHKQNKHFMYKNWNRKGESN